MFQQNSYCLQMWLVLLQYDIYFKMLLQTYSNIMLQSFIFLQECFVINPSLLFKLKLITGFSEQPAEVQGQNKNAWLPERGAAAS